MEIPAENPLSEIFKWVGLAFAAGFIGYFGRYLSMLIIERLRKRKLESTPEPVKEVPAQYDLAQRSLLKLEKKRAKLEAKQAKKAKKKPS